MPSAPSGKSFRCLGVQFNYTRLNGIEGKQLILQQTRSLVAMLRKHFHDADQIDRVMKFFTHSDYSYLSVLISTPWVDGERTKQVTSAMGPRVYGGVWALSWHDERPPDA